MTTNESTRVDFPWEGVGVNVEESMTVSDMLKKADLDWEIDKRPLYYHDSHRGDPIQFKANYALVNVLTDKAIGVCGPDYQPVQNAKAFEFFEKFVDRGAMRMEAIGSFKSVKGLHVWALASLNHEFVLPGDDHVKGYVLLSHPHVWGQTLQIKPTAMRIYCYNSLMAALRGNECFKHYHTAEFGDEAVDRAQNVVSATIRYMDQVKEKAEFLSRKRAELPQLGEYVAKLFQPGLVQTLEEVRTIMGPNSVLDSSQFHKNARRVWDSIFMSPGAHSKAAEGTWWGAVNGVTYAVDHKLGKDRELSLSDAWIGTRASKKLEALELAVEYAKAA